jgi:hypothetical protein
MSDFASGLENNLKPGKGALDRKVDSNREKFIKGISNTKFGKKEDPTYLCFKFIFDFGVSGEIDQETFLPSSPLFKKIEGATPNESSDHYANEKQKESRKKDKAGEDLTPKQPDYKDYEKSAAFGSGKYRTDTDFFYGSKLKIGENFKGAFPTTGGVAYLSAQEFLLIRSEKRYQMIKAFRNGLDYINKNCPYFFQSLTGFDSLVKSNYNKAGFNKRTGKLTIDCLESIDMRVSALAELYRKAIYDYTNYRFMLPENLRKFRMWVVVTEIRNIQLSQGGMNDILNPFSVPVVAKVAGSLDSFNSQTGLLNKIGLNQKSTNEDNPDSPEFGSYDMLPYAWIYQLDQCEFDFDDTYPFSNSIDNKGGSAVSTKFSINVGRVKDHKIQFNQLADFLGKDDNLQSMVLNDTWNPNTSYNQMDYADSEGIDKFDPGNGSSAGTFFAKMASNFITNSLGDLKNTLVSKVQNKLLGNIYGFGGLDLKSATSSFQALNDTIKSGIPNPFQKNNPQSKGLGGPSERQYPKINEDAYINQASSSNNKDLGNVLPKNGINQTSLKDDVYPDTSQNIYNSSNKSDEYKDNPGKDLGVPGRVYPDIKEDAYPKVPSSNQYPSNKDDEYKDNPGKDLGVPTRVYQDIKEDAYPKVPSSNQYPSNKDDEYKNNPGKDLGVPGRVYTEVKEDAYPTVKGKDLGTPDRVYPINEDDLYEDDKKSETRFIGRVYSK